MQQQQVTQALMYLSGLGLGLGFVEVEVKLSDRLFTVVYL